MISIQGAVTIIIYLVVGGIIFGLLKWLIDASPIPGQFKQIAQFVLIALAVLVLIGVLLSFAGVVQGPLFRP